VDASQGAEEMLERLTDKVLQQEEQIQQLDEEKNDLASYMILLSFNIPAVHLDISRFFHHYLSGISSVGSVTLEPLI